MQNKSEIKESYFIEDLSTLIPLEENLDSIENTLFLFKIIIWLAEKEFDRIFEENRDIYQNLWKSRMEVAVNGENLFMNHFFPDLKYPNCSLVNLVTYCLHKKDHFTTQYLIYSLIQNLQYSEEGIASKTFLNDFMNVKLNEPKT